MNTDAMPVSVYDLYLSFMSLVIVQLLLQRNAPTKFMKINDPARNASMAWSRWDYLSGPTEYNKIENRYDHPAHHENDHYVPEEQVFELSYLREVFGEPEDDRLLAILVMRELPVETCKKPRSVFDYLIATFFVTQKSIRLAEKKISQS